MTGRWRVAPLLGLYRPALVAAAVGLLFSIAGAAAVARWEDRVNKIEFENAAETESIVMQNGMSEYISRLVALRTLFESTNEEITRSEFETFSARLFERHPGMLRIAWLPRVNRKERAEYEAAAIAGRRLQLSHQVAPGRQLRHRAAERRIFPCVLLDPAEDLDGLRHGLCERSGTSRGARTCARQRPDRGHPHAPLRPSVRRAGCRTCSLPFPFMPRAPRATTVADRRRNLAGFVVGVFDLPLLMQAIRVTTGASPAVSVNVYPPFTGASSASRRHAAGFCVGSHRAAVDARRRAGAALGRPSQDR